MQVHLAGHNIDRDFLMEIRAALQTAANVPAGLSPETDEARRQAREILERDNWTPETLSAAYARISRDPRPVNELRAVAREQVDQARRSNERIIFGFGHASVAEHAVFNLDILGLSRLAAEEIERMRLCSYTEKSQRYILLDEDFVVPEEVRKAGLQEDFRTLLQRQNAFYRTAYERLHPWVFGQNPKLAAEKKNHRLLEGLAKEDARYGLSLATTVQIGETINARNLESLIARTAAHPLAELREFSHHVYKAVAEVAPSVIKHTKPSDYLLKTPQELRDHPASKKDAPPSFPIEEVILIDLPNEAEIRVATALLHSYGTGDSDRCGTRATGSGRRGLLDIVRTALAHLGPHDSVLREFEHTSLHFELVVSAACFGQLKRHRMATLTTQDYDPRLGMTIPPSFEPTGLVAPLEELCVASQKLWHTLRERVGPHVAPYVLLNAHRRRVLWTANVRELYHVARLRLDSHAQWDIRRLAERIIDLAREDIPYLLMLACGKDRFDEVRGREFGE